MNRNLLIGCGVPVGLSILGNIAWAQTWNDARPQMAQNSLSDQVRQQVLHPNTAPGGAAVGGAMGVGMSPGMIGMGPAPPQGSLNLPMEGMFGSRVTPIMNLSAEDVRYYLANQLERLKNKRLKLGEVTAEEGTITADIVTVDNSLVQRLKVDRHTGLIKYED
jgi:hypothetical protein